MLCLIRRLVNEGLPHISHCDAAALVWCLGMAASAKNYYLGLRSIPLSHLPIDLENGISKSRKNLGLRNLQPPHPQHRQNTHNMGWFWSKTPKADGNPLDNLDPSLRDFFDKSTAPKEDGSGQNAPPPSEGSREEVNEEKKGIWATYVPPKVHEPPPQDIFLSILQKYKIKQHSINDAALINCSMEQAALHDCYSNGTWSQKLGLCRDQSREFEGCLDSQIAVLKEIGYEGDGSEADLKRQAYSDRLYRQERDNLMREKELSAADAAEKLATRAAEAKKKKEEQKEQNNA